MDGSFIFISSIAKISGKKLIQFLILVLILLLMSSDVAERFPNEWIVWNIGQGSFITRVETHRCIHFDAGGDRPFPSGVVKSCRGKENIVLFSHSDWDHISFAWQLHKFFPKLCRYGPDDKLKKSLRSIEVCSTTEPEWSWHPGFQVRSANDSSGVYYYRELLYPGDSPKKFEKFWVTWRSRLPKNPCSGPSRKPHRNLRKSAESIQINKNGHRLSSKSKIWSSP